MFEVRSYPVHATCRLLLLWVGRVLLVCCVAGAGFVQAEEEADEFQSVVIADPFIEMHTGAGGVYPVFHVVDRGETVTILKRKNDWFRLRTLRGIEGWASREQLARTLNPDGSEVVLQELGEENFQERRWEYGAAGGDFEGASVLSVYGAYHFTPNISTELTLGQATGNFSDSWYVNLSVVQQPFPEWSYSPFLAVGTGTIRTEPRATLVASEDRTDQMLSVGAGVRTFLGDRFAMRLEYQHYTIVTSRDDNDLIEEWKLGFAIYF